MTALWLLSPQTPLFFQGQEFAATAPFLFFADYQGEMATAVTRGLGEFLSQFPPLASPEARKLLSRPTDEDTFRRSILNLEERQTNSEIYQMHRDLLKLRREDPIFSAQRSDWIETLTMNEHCLTVRYYGPDHNDRVVLSNFGPHLLLSAMPNPLLATPPAARWKMIWASDDRQYGGSGSAPLETEDGWRIPGEATVVFATEPID